MNWNRTPAHQLWGKYSHMNALVDDLFTFPMGSADGDGGETKVHLITGGPDLVVRQVAAARQRVRRLDVRSVLQLARLRTWACMGLDLGIPGTNDQGRERSALRGHAGIQDRLHRARELADLDARPIATRARSLSAPTSRRSRAATTSGLGYRVDYLHLDNWQPERANPRGRFDFAGNSTRTFGTGSQTANFYNQYAAFLLGLVGTASKSYQYELFTGREWQHAMFFRDRWTVNHEAHAGSRRAVGVLPDHVARRSADRDAGPADARCPDRRGRRQSEEHGPRRAEGRVSRRGSAPSIV